MEKNLTVHSTLQYATHMCMASLGSFVFLSFFCFFVLSPPLSCKKKSRSMLREMCFIIQNSLKNVCETNICKRSKILFLFFPSIYPKASKLAGPGLEIRQRLQKSSNFTHMSFPHFFKEKCVNKSASPSPKNE